MQLPVLPAKMLRPTTGVMALAHSGLLLGIILFFAGTVTGISGPDNPVQFKKTRDLSDKDSVSIARLFLLSEIYCNYFGDVTTANRLGNEAIRIAEAGSGPELCLQSYFHYLEIPDLGQIYFENADRTAMKASVLVKGFNDPNRKWRLYKDLAELYISVSKFNLAMKYSNLAIGMAGNVGKNSLRVKSYLLFARCLEGNKHKTNAHGCFLNAVELAEKMKDPLLMIYCYHQLSGFYSRNKMFEQSIKYKLKEKDLTRRVFRSDSVKQMWVQWDILDIGLASGAGLDENTLHHLLTFAVAHHAEKLKSWTLAIYRSYFINKGRIERLFSLYTKEYPAEFNRLAKDDPAMYFKLMAYFKEMQKVPDSALYYLRQAEPFILNNPSKYMQSQFYYRFGQFLSRQNMKKEASDKFHLAYSIAEEVPYYDVMLISSRQLEGLSFSMGDYADAYHYSVLTRNLDDSINDMARKEQMILNGINREQQVRDRINEDQKRESERMIRQKQTERNSMAVIVAFLFILSFVIFRNYRFQKKSNIRLDQEKRRSDGLLLNILPAETAEELKQTGKAKAKHFEEVTVMFTDFKNFTQASEKMQAEELVEEIHFYFSEFDRIVARYPIEKIKTIGDSYMCVGGLPQRNETHAVDVVNAALELQEFIEARKGIRSDSGKPVFELRIGIHTGPVVAGIVGTRKFAYDIWGDTVNTASRMESSGEPGKVNISGTTYEKIKDHFSCTYRGKVPAKHKGLIDMYFASRRP
jgi:class 3 adenylate cyclase